MSLRHVLVSVLLATLPLAMPAHADGDIQTIITPADKARLEHYADAKTKAVEAAAKSSSPTDVATFKRILARPDKAFRGFDMTGDWQCRTIKAGGVAPLVIYDWFKCRVADDGAGWTLTKLSGSQRTTGRFFTESDTRLTYLGSYFTVGGNPPPYGSGSNTDQVGYAYLSGKDRWRIEFPDPARESVLDILQFRR